MFLLSEYDVHLFDDEADADCGDDYEDSDHDLSRWIIEKLYVLEVVFTNDISEGYCRN